MLKLGDMFLLYGPYEEGVYRVVEKKREPIFFVDLVDIGDLSTPLDISGSTKYSVKFTPMIPERSKPILARRFDLVVSRLGIKIVDPMDMRVDYEGPQFYFGATRELQLTRGMGIEVWSTSGTEETRETLSFTFEIAPRHKRVARVEVDAEKYGVKLIERTSLGSILEAIDLAASKGFKLVVAYYPNAFTFENFFMEEFFKSGSVTSTGTDTTIVSVPSVITGESAGFKFIKVRDLIITNKATSDATVTIKDENGDISFDVIVPASSSVFMKPENGIDFYGDLILNTNQAPLSVYVGGYYW